MSSDARTVMAYLHWCHYIGYQVVDGKMVADRPFDTSSCHPEEFYEMADADLAALAEAGFVITTRERWDALVRVAEGIERVVASKAREGSE